MKVPAEFSFISQLHFVHLKSQISMKSATFDSITILNSTFILDWQNMNRTNQSKLDEDVRIDDFSNIFGPIEIRIIWLLSWIMFQFFTNTIFIFFIIYEKHGG